MIRQRPISTVSIVSTMAIVLFATAAQAQQATDSAIASFLFGSRNLSIATPNGDGNYTMVLHVDDDVGYNDLEYDSTRGYGFEVIDPGNTDRGGAARFGPFDNSPNNRGNLDPTFDPNLEIYNSFIGFKDFTHLCDIQLVGNTTDPCPIGAEALLRQQGDPPADPPLTGTYQEEGGTFRVDVPNGFYRFVGVFGDVDNTHAHRVVIEDGGTGGPSNIDYTNSEILVNSYDQNQAWFGTAGDVLGEGVFATVGFEDSTGTYLPPMPNPDDFFPDDPLPSFLPIDENGLEIKTADNQLIEGSLPNSPVLEVTQGYLRLHLMQGNSNRVLDDGMGGRMTDVLPFDPDAPQAPMSRQDRNGGDIVLFEIVPVDGPFTGGDVCGDFDRDGDIDAADRTIQTVGWTGAMPPGTGGAVFTDGDCDADGDVDTADQTGLIGNWTGALNAGGLEDDGDVDLVYDPESGNVTLDANDAASGVVVSFVIGTDHDNMDAANFDRPFIDVGTNTDATAFQMGQTDPLNQGAGPLVDLGNILPTGLDQQGLSDYLTLAQYASALGAGGELDLVVVPEPSSVALILMGLFGLALRRRS